MLKVALMWTINYFPTCGILSRYKTQGKLACSICMEYTRAFTLKFGKKNSWFDCHKKFLHNDYLQRRNRYGFRKNSIKEDEPLFRLNGHQILENVRHFLKIVKVGGFIRIPSYGI